MRQNMTPEEIEACWKDPRNRKWGILYFCNADPRVIVPKRLKWMGWTVNAAHPSAIPITLLLLAILAVPIWIVNALGGGSGIALVAFAASITVVCFLCACLSSLRS
jgi:hypothetical protein